MRLIDADKLLYEDVKSTDGATYLVVHAPYIDNAPTAFDLKSVIEKLEDKALEYSIKADCEQNDRNTLLEASRQGVIQGIDIALKIMKSAAIPQLQVKLKKCPKCGEEIDIEKNVYLPERDWRPTFGDPNSGGNPISLRCKCGIEFNIHTYDFGEFAQAWNNRIEKTTHPDCFTPEENVAYPLCIGKNFPKCKICKLRASFEPEDA